ncbi:MAG: oligosaccharide flippase family protein [Acidobacteria bacterium]|nr:oligosaccharide flippase family protein [Acidobacteriota bacterium]
MSEAVARAKNQGIWLALGQIVTRGAQFASTIVLARLLVPESFGKVAIAAVVWEVVALFGNTGVAVGFPEDRRLLLGTLGERSAWARWAQFRRGLAATILGREGGA